MKANGWAKHAGTILGVEIQKYVMKKKISWKKLEYSVDTSLAGWFQENKADTIHTLPNNVTANLEGCMLVLVYNLSGTVKDIGNEPKIHPVYGGIAFTGGTFSEVKNASGELNKFDNLFYTTSVFDPDGNQIFTVRTHATDLDDAVESIVESSTQLQLKGDTKAITGPLTIDTTGINAKFQTGKALFITGSIMTFAGFGVIVGGTNHQSIVRIGFTLYSIGQTGLILCGASNCIMRSAITGATGLNYSLSPKGYIRFGSGLALFAGGLSMLGIGMKNDVIPLLFTGIFSITAGQALSPLAWSPFLRDYKRLNNKFRELNISPSLSVSNDGNTSVLSDNC